MNENKSPNQQLSPALVERLLNIQEQEVVLRGQELNLRKQNDANAHEYAKAALEANVKDREAERSCMKDTMKYRYIFAGLIIFLLIILFCIALFLNKDAIVMEIIKAIMFFGAGGIGGYAYAQKIHKENG